MKYVVIAILLLIVSCNTLDASKLNVSEPKDTTQKPNQQGTVETESPVIVNGATVIVPGTEIKGDTTVSTKPTPTTIIPSTPSTPTTSTNKPTVPTTTASPKTTNATVLPTSQAPPTTASTTPSPTTHTGFDGPSFVGGIVLALGLVAIGFVAFKFYKARTELNYHTL